MHQPRLAPSRYIQGRFELDHIKTYTETYGRKVFFLVDVFFYRDLKVKFEAQVTKMALA